MNKERRKKLDDVIYLLQASKDIIDKVQTEESDAFYNLTDGLQCTERGMKMEECIDNMEDAMGLIDDTVDLLEDCKL